MGLIWELVLLIDTILRCLTNYRFQATNKLYDVGEIFKYSQSASSLIYLQIFKEIGTSFLRMKDGSEIKHTIIIIAMK